MEFHLHSEGLGDLGLFDYARVRSSFHPPVVTGVGASASSLLNPRRCLIPSLILEDQDHNYRRTTVPVMRPGLGLGVYCESRRALDTPPSNALNDFYK
jgi:hypothetical protein